MIKPVDHTHKQVTSQGFNFSVASSYLLPTAVLIHHRIVQLLLCRLFVFLPLSPIVI